MSIVAGNDGSVLVGKDAETAADSERSGEDIEDDTLHIVHKEKDFISLLSCTPGKFNSCPHCSILQLFLHDICYEVNFEFQFLHVSPAETSSYRHKVNGSFLIQFLKEVFCTSAHEDDVDVLFRKV